MESIEFTVFIKRPGMPILSWLIAIARLLRSNAFDDGRMSRKLFDIMRGEAMIDQIAICTRSWS